MTLSFDLMTLHGLYGMVRISTVQFHEPSTKWSSHSAFKVTRLNYTMDTKTLFRPDGLQVAEGRMTLTFG